MQCEDAISQICARIDGELSDEDCRALDEHLACCPDCRASADAMQIQDAQLVRGFASGRRSASTVADRVAAQVSTRARNRLGPLSLASAAAAGFLLALLLFRPWQKTSAPSAMASTTFPTIGTLDIATGPVELLAPGKSEWERMVTGAVVPRDARLRTGPDVRCELVMTDGSQVRINQNSELLLNGARRLDLAMGQVFSSVAHGPGPFQVTAADATVTALGTRFDVQRTQGQVILAVLDGQTRLSGPSGQHTIEAGKVVRLSRGHVEPVEASEALDRATRWIDELLVLKGRNSPELTARIDDLLAQIGQEKMAFFRENDLKALGFHCVEPLTKYIQSDRSSGEAYKRQAAARIIDDVAQPWCIPYLIELLSDRDDEVRFHAARALERLTGQTQNHNLQEWHEQPASAGQSAIDAWKQWWAHNREKYPGSERIQTAR